MHVLCTVHMCVHVHGSNAKLERGSVCYTNKPMKDEGSGVVGKIILPGCKSYTILFHCDIRCTHAIKFALFPLYGSLV